MGAEKESPPPGKVFFVHFKQSELKITVQDKALHKPFNKKIVEPALKAFNAKLAAEERIELDGIEKVMIGPGGWVRSDDVPDTSVSVASLIPADQEEGMRVDFLQKVERQVKVICTGLEVEALIPPEFVHLSLADTVLAPFIQRFNETAQMKISADDIAAVKVERHSGDGPETVDMSLPAWQLIQRAGRIAVHIVLKPDAAAAASASVVESKAYKDAERQAKVASGEIAPDQVFRVRLGVSELKLTLTPKALGKTVRGGLIEPFLKALNKKRAGGKHQPLIDVEQIVRIEADGKAVADALRASSLVSGAPVVRLELFMASSDGAPAASAPTKAAVDYSRWADVGNDDDDDDATPNAPLSTRAPSAGKKVTRRSYSEWDQLQLDSGDEGDPSGSSSAPIMDGRLLLRDPNDTSRGWHDEAEALFRLTRDQAIGFPLQYATYAPLVHQPMPAPLHPHTPRAHARLPHMAGIHVSALRMAQRVARAAAHSATRRRLGLPSRRRGSMSSHSRSTPCRSTCRRARTPTASTGSTAGPSYGCLPHMTAMRSPRRRARSQRRASRRAASSRKHCCPGGSRQRVACRWSCSRMAGCRTRAARTPSGSHGT